jgi:3-methyladenine DNA glycosylase AlkD
MNGYRPSWPSCAAWGVSATGRAWPVTASTSRTPSASSSTSCAGWPGSLGTDHDLALALWTTRNHEARLLACFVDDPTAVTAEQTEAWVCEFDSWDICDQATTSLFDRTRHAWSKAADWAEREEVWSRRAGFALMAGLAAHDKSAPHRAFMTLLPSIERGAFDERNLVKTAANWALRNIGKRNRTLNAPALACAGRILAAANRRAGGERGGDPGSRAARWVARDAIRELASDRIRARPND